MMRVLDAIERGVAHVDVRGGHVDLRTKRARAVLKLAVLHPLEQVEVLLDGAVAIRAVLTGLGQRAAVFAHLVFREVVHIGEPLLDELDGKLVAPIKVGGTEAELIPMEAQPFDVVLDRIDVLDVLLGRVRIVKAQIAASAILFRHAKVDAQRLCVADVQIAVRLGREAGLDARLLRAHIFFNELLDEVLAADCFLHTKFLHSN
ncbi:uncharacterized protein BN454_00172 [Clostridium sp. CAG:1024]|nr:uncharacterized protein BN454_00172 [Clostridium sp. CAG:1024]